MNHVSSNAPHQGQPVIEAGAPLHRAKVAVILVHGRGATADGMVSLADVLVQPEAAYLAPQAAGRTWYPYSFLAPLQQNEPGLSSALAMLQGLLARLTEAGLPPERTVLLGFSQGACLSTEFAARHPRRYGGVVGLSGGLIGSSDLPGVASPDDKRFDYEGDLAGTPVFLGRSDVDPHIPLARVERTAEVLEALGGDVTKRIYPGMGHTISHDEVKFVRGLLAALVEG
jgi:predicted esterase